MNAKKGTRAEKKNSKYSTMLVDEPIKARAARSPIEPQNNRVLGWIPFRNDKVVKEIFPLGLINGHIP